MQGNNIFAAVSKFKDASRTKVINFQRELDRICEANTRSRIEDYLRFSGDLFVHVWIHTEFILHEVAFDGYDALIDNFQKFRPIFKKWLEQLSAENFFSEPVLERNVLFWSD